MNAHLQSYDSSLVLGVGWGPGDLRKREDEAADHENTERATAEETATAAGAGTTGGLMRGGSEAKDGPGRGVDFLDTHQS